MKSLIHAYRKLLKANNYHVYATNTCYDHCAHCYMSAVPIGSRNSKYIDMDDLLHFINLVRQGHGSRINLGLSGGDPLLHPDIIRLVKSTVDFANLDFLTSGFAFSERNTTNRDELIECLSNRGIRIINASSGEPYHSITREDYEEIKKYIRKKGYHPSGLGIFPDPTRRIREILKSMRIRTHSPKVHYDPAIPIGRAKNLPEEQRRPGFSCCDITMNLTDICIGYQGNLQYCMYSVHDGFMNIRELRAIHDKEQAINLILERLVQDQTFRDMVQYKRCYFSRKVRKRLTQPEEK